MRPASALLAGLVCASFFAAAHWAQSAADVRDIGATLLPGRKLLKVRCRAGARPSAARRRRLPRRGPTTRPWPHSNEQDDSEVPWYTWLMVGYAALGLPLGLVLGHCFALRRHAWHRAVGKRTACATAAVDMVMLVVLAVVQLEEVGFLWVGWPPGRGVTWDDSRRRDRAVRTHQPLLPSPPRPTGAHHV